MLNFNPLQKFSNIQKFVPIQRLIHANELSEKTVNAIVAIGVALYVFFIVYREYNGVG